MESEVLECGTGSELESAAVIVAVAVALFSVAVCVLAAALLKRLVHDPVQQTRTSWRVT